MNYFNVGEIKRQLYWDNFVKKVLEKNHLNSTFKKKFVYPGNNIQRPSKKENYLNVSWQALQVPQFRCVQFKRLAY